MTIINLGTRRRQQITLRDAIAEFSLYCFGIAGLWVVAFVAYAVFDLPKP